MVVLFVATDDSALIGVDDFGKVAGGIFLYASILFI